MSSHEAGDGEADPALLRVSGVLLRRGPPRRGTARRPGPCSGCRACSSAGPPGGGRGHPPWTPIRPERFPKGSCRRCPLSLRVEDADLRPAGAVLRDELLVARGDLVGVVGG